MKAFPATRYYGSKRRHLHWIHHHLSKLKFKTALDVFAGTASVTLLLEGMGAHVDYHDSANFNYRQAQGLTKRVTAEDAKVALSLLKGIRPCAGYISDNFEGKYFTPKENAWLDGYLELDKSLKTRRIRQVLFYAVAQACLQKRPFNLFHRDNLSIRLNQSVFRSFGNATTWNRSFSELTARHVWSAHELSMHRGTSTTIRVLKPQSPLSLSAGYDLVYVDPPYLPAHRSVERYMLRYHFLEGMSSPHKWSRISRDLAAPLASNELWEDKSTCQDLLEKLIEKHKGSTLVLSYASEGVPAIDEIISLFKGRFRKFEVHSYSARRAMSNSSYSDVLIIGIRGTFLFRPSSDE